MALKGRHWVALWLLGFLAVAWVVIARQTSALHTARELADGRAARATLEGRRAELERRIRTARSRAVLLPLAQHRLRLRLPSDTDIILLPVPGSGPR